KCREIKINNLNLELEKVVKEIDELKDKIAKWEESSKNLDEILNSQMSARDKTGLGSNHETDSENSLSIFDVRSSDEENTPENDRFSKNGYKAVPPPITGNFLTPRADISFTGEGKPVWDNTKRINHQNFSKYPHLSKIFVPSGVLTRTGLHRPNVSTAISVSTARSISTARPSVSTARHVSTTRPSVSTARPVSIARPVSTARPVSIARPVSTARPNVSTARPSVSTVRPISTARPNVSTAKPSVSTARPAYATRHTYLIMDNVRPRDSCLPI
ncbi:hypothetical protein Tco_1574607, partial [Tanacetum coccineum]